LQTRDAFAHCDFLLYPAHNTPHLHRTTDETFLIEAGEVEISRGGEVLSGRRGDVIHLPKGCPSSLTTTPALKDAWY
jgi:ethanolamine utilization protein EutQ (cupin superfamily)